MKALEQPTSGLTKIQVCNNKTVIYEHNLAQDKTKLAYFIVQEGIAQTVGQDPGLCLQLQVERP